MSDLRRLIPPFFCLEQVTLYDMKQVNETGIKRKGTPHIVFWDSVRCREEQ